MMAGSRDFNESWIRNAPPDTAWPQSAPDINSVLVTCGFSTLSEAPGSIVYSRKYSPGLYWVLYILLFPIGLLFLLARPVETITVRWAPEGEGTRFNAYGQNAIAGDFFRSVAAA